MALTFEYRQDRKIHSAWTGDLRGHAGFASRAGRLSVALVILCALFMPLGAQVQLGRPSSVPAGLATADAQELEKKYAGLTAQFDSVSRDLTDLSQRCGRVPSNDAALVASCREQQSKAMQEIDAYRRALAAYELVRQAYVAAGSLEKASPGGAPTPTAISRIGAAGAVQGDVLAVQPDGSTVAIASGTPLFLNEHVRTGPGARLQVGLLDESVFTLGPDSDMVLDEFVYDPNLTVSKFAARITKGVFRFVTGKVARRDPHNMRIRVPTGDLGFRGTDAEVSVAPDSSSTVKLYSGEAEWTSHKTGSVLVLRAGQTISIDAQGVVGRPGPITP